MFILRVLVHACMHARILAVCRFSGGDVVSAIEHLNVVRVSYVAKVSRTMKSTFNRSNFRCSNRCSYYETSQGSNISLSLDGMGIACE